MRHCRLVAKQAAGIGGLEPDRGDFVVHVDQDHGQPLGVGRPAHGEYGALLELGGAVVVGRLDQVVDGRVVEVRHRLQGAPSDLQLLIRPVGGVEERVEDPVAVSLYELALLGHRRELAQDYRSRRSDVQGRIRGKEGDQRPDDDAVFTLPQAVRSLLPDGVVRVGEAGPHDCAEVQVEVVVAQLRQPRQYLAPAAPVEGGPLHAEPGDLAVWQP